MKKLCIVTAIALIGLSAESIAARTVVFDGIVWDVRAGAGGPGNGCWSDASDAVWVDSEGLHLQMTLDNEGNWCQAQVTARAFARSGTHRFYVVKDLDELDDDLVLGMFLYRTDQIEIDIEVTRSFNGVDLGFYAVHGCNFVNGTAPRDSFDFSMSGTHSTHKFDWSDVAINFESYHGHCEAAPCGGPINDWSYSGTNVPLEAANLRPSINLWQCVEEWCNGDGVITPASGIHEIVIASYDGPTVSADSEEEYIAPVVADAGLRGGGFANNNYGGQVGGDAEQRLLGYGNDDSIYLDFGAAPIRGALEFDLSNIPEDREVGAAFLVLAPQLFIDVSSCAGTPKELAEYCYETVTLAPYLDSWSETSVTWNNRPGVDSPALTEGCFPESGFNPTIELPITAHVERWLSSESNNFGLELSVPAWEDEFPTGRYYSQREDSGVDPMLRILLVREMFSDGFESGDTSAWSKP